jgi:outer membrane receptor protein involved in Fe transport
MSGVVSMDMRTPTKRTETELSLSFFNASAISMGSLGGRDQGDWLVAARRGNLDLIVDVIDPEFGSPDYNDLLLHVGWDFGPLAVISANALVSYDKISLLDSGAGETANAKYENLVYWLKWDAEWSEILHSETIVSFNEINDERLGVLNLPGIVSGTLSESRDFTAFEIQQDWRFTPSDRWMLSFGFRARDQDADYVHASTRTITSPFDQILDNTPFISRDYQLSPDGAQYAAYSELRWRPGDSLVLDLGLRWDQQTYTASDDDRQYSPRASILWSFSDQTELRLGFGQFYQAQEINELQVSDGVTEFFPAQRALHSVANIKHKFGAGVDLDVSLYRKAFRSLRPRFENTFNALTLLPELQFDRVRVDALRAESHGVELTASFGSGSDDLFWWLGYAWSEVEDSLSTGKVKRSWDQTHTFKGGVSWRWGPWDISAAGEAHTGWPKTELGGLRNETRYSVFHTLDARVSRDFTLRRGELTAFLEVTNLYNRSNQCCTEYSLQPTASGTDELVAREAHWLPILPSLGVVWRF